MDLAIGHEGRKPGRSLPDPAPATARLADRVLSVAQQIADQEKAQAWLVGGTVRDRLLKRPLADLDVVVAPPLTPALLARRVAAELERPCFLLSDRFDTHRVVLPGGHLDVTAMRGSSLEEDLALRDFTVNAMAQPLSGEELTDPFGGREDLAARRLAAVSDHIFQDDPLRLLRVGRFSMTLGFHPDPQLRAMARHHAALLPRAAPERIWMEIAATLESGEGSRPALLWDELGLLAVLFPEVKRLQGVGQSTNHQFDVYGHTLEALEQLEGIMARPERVFPDSAEAVRRRLRQPVDGAVGRRAALRLAVLLHDVAKPFTRSIDSRGRLSFRGHEEQGAPIAREVCARLHTSFSVASLVEAVVSKHLLLGFLQNRKPLWERDVVAFLWATAPWEPEVVLACVSDRLATQGPMTAPRFINRHLALARHLMWVWWQREQNGVPGLPLPGDEIGRRVGVEPGPRLGVLLRRLKLLWEAGETKDEKGLIHEARRVLEEESSEDRDIL